MAINAESVSTPWPYHDSERIFFYQWSHSHWAIWKIDITAPIYVSTGHVTMMTPSNGNVFRVTDLLWIHWSPVRSQRPMTGSFDVFLELRRNKWLSKQSRRRWFGTPSRLLWRYCNDPGDHGLLLQSGTVITLSNPSIIIHPLRMSFDDLTSASGNSRQGTCPFEICSRILMTSTERIRSI